MAERAARRARPRLPFDALDAGDALDRDRRAFIGTNSPSLNAQPALQSGQLDVGVENGGGLPGMVLLMYPGREVGVDACPLTCGATASSTRLSTDATARLGLTDAKTGCRMNGT